MSISPINWRPLLLPYFNVSYSNIIFIKLHYHVPVATTYGMLITSSKCINFLYQSGNDLFNIGSCHPSNKYIELINFAIISLLKCLFQTYFSSKSRYNSTPIFCAVLSGSFFTTMSSDRYPFRYQRRAISKPTPSTK
jgi:hypothetical protein